MRIAGLRSAALDARVKLLSRINRPRLSRALDKVPSGTTPVFMIFTPEVCHYAPYCLAQRNPRFSPVLITNSVSEKDVSWLGDLYPDLPMVELKTTIRGRSGRLLPHGSILNDLFATVDRDFCIQDPDCFVVDPAFWEQVSLESEYYAGGPFWDRSRERSHVLPHTFFVMLSVAVYRKMAARFGIDAAITRVLPERARTAAARIGYPPGSYPHDFKDYFDTLQAFWIASLSEGYRFYQMSGDREVVHHIGGTSYLFRSDIDPAFGDFWPLGVQYFNLRLLELPQGARFRKRFKVLFGRYGSAEGLLRETPLFRNGWRRKQLDEILGVITR